MQKLNGCREEKFMERVFELREEFSIFVQEHNADLAQGWIQGGAIGAIAPLKPMKVTLFTMILYNSENNIPD